MTTYTVKFNREFEVTINAATLSLAESIAKQVISQFPKDTCKMLSIIPVGAAVDTLTTSPTRAEHMTDERNLAFKNKVLAEIPEPGY